MASGDQQIVAQAAQKWGVPSGILWGVYGMETSYGQDLSTSSTGAQGPFQFEPATAASYGGPAALGQHGLGPAADAAAHYLHDLFSHTGSWDSALHSYSGGGYGLAQVQAKAQGGPTSGGNVGVGVTATGARTTDSGGLVPSINLGDLGGPLIKAAVWIAFVAGGAALIYIGLTKSLGITPVRAGAKVAKKAAEVAAT